MTVRYWVSFKWYQLSEFRNNIPGDAFLAQAPEFKMCAECKTERCGLFLHYLDLIVCRRICGLLWEHAVTDAIPAQQGRRLVSRY